MTNTTERVMRPVRLAALAAAAVLFVSGCTATDAEAENAQPEGSGDPTAETVPFTWERNTAAEDADPVYETTTVEVPKHPETIVAFDMASLDTVGALGGEVAGAPLDSVPDYLEGYLVDDAFNAGTLFEADLVEIESHEPDLILIGGRSSGLYDDLSEIAPTIDLSISGSFLETLERNTTFLGEVLGAEAEAETALDELTAGIDEARAATADLGTGLGIMVSGGELSALAPAGDAVNGRNARGGLIYDVFGVTPVVDDIAATTHDEPVSFEFVLEHDPDVLWVIDRDAATQSDDGAQPASAVLDNAIIHETTAWKNDRIVYLDPTAWYIVFGGIDTTRIMIDDVVAAATA